MYLSFLETFLTTGPPSHTPLLFINVSLYRTFFNIINALLVMFVVCYLETLTLPLRGIRCQLRLPRGLSNSKCHLSILIFVSLLIKNMCLLHIIRGMLVRALI